MLKTSTSTSTSTSVSSPLLDGAKEDIDASARRMYKIGLHTVGFALEQRAFALEQVEKLRDALDALCDGRSASETVFVEGSSGKIKQIQHLQHEHVDGQPVFRVLLDAVLPKMAELMDVESSALQVVNMQFFNKHPGISKPTRHHQDNAYLRLLHGDKAITAWIPLDDVDPSNGCLHYVPYSHKMPTLRHERYNAATTFRVRSGVPGLSLCTRAFRESDDIAVEATAGDILYHLGTTVHRANANTSTKQRRAIGVLAIVKAYDGKDPVLEAEAKVRLEEDIALQEYRDFDLYQTLRAKAPE